jgi:hypothetical protein
MLNPTFRTQLIKKGIGLQNTIKLEREEILRRQLIGWDVGGVS